METNGKQFRLQRLPHNVILDIAETTERRQAKLDRFFREAYAKVSCSSIQRTLPVYYLIFTCCSTNQILVI